MKIITIAAFIIACAAAMVISDVKPEPAALFNAVERGDVKATELILRKGADINAKDQMGRTALHLAVSRGNTDILKMILSRNPDVNAQDDLIGTTPLALAASRNYIDGVRLLLEQKPSLEKGTSSMPLSFIAMESDNQKILTLLCDAGMSLSATIDNYESSNGVTCLMYAAFTGKPESVKFLLTRSTDVNALDSNGDPAIIWALYYDKPDIARILIESGKKINYRTTGTGAPKGALDLAKRKEFDEIARIIMKADGQPD